MALIYAALHPDTQIQFKDDDGVYQTNALSDLVTQYKAVDKPIIVLSLTANKIVQDANGIEINSRDLAKNEYQITLSNGAIIKCTSSTLFGIKKSTNTKKVSISTITGFSYLAASYLAVGDQLMATNESEYLEITSIVIDSSSFKEYFGITAPVYGNFLVEAVSPDGVATSIVVGN